MDVFAETTITLDKYEILFNLNERTFYIVRRVSYRFPTLNFLFEENWGHTTFRPESASYKYFIIRHKFNFFII